MSGRAGLVWNAAQYFNRFIEDCGIACELVTPYMLAAPFYRSSFNCLIIPSGFANPQYSNLLPALRATSPRIQKFVEAGGNLLVFGAATDKPNAYDWLPFQMTYHHDFHPRQVTCTSSSQTGTIINDYDPANLECDGSFLSGDGENICVSGRETVVIEKKVGLGKIVATSIHEYPSKSFLIQFCNDGVQTQF
jgi:hypothetical protein